MRAALHVWCWWCFVILGVTDVWPLKYSLENHKPLPEAKSWDLENVVQDLQVREVGPKNQVILSSCFRYLQKEEGKL